MRSVVPTLTSHPSPMLWSTPMRRLLLLAAVAALCLALAVPVPAAAQTTATWTINYFNNLDWAGFPVATTFSNTAAFNWGGAPPAPGVNGENWTATLTSVPWFNAGIHRFTVQADDEVVLVVDGITYIDSRGMGQSGKTLTVDIPLAQGNRSVVVHYRQYTQAAFLFVSWAIIKSATPTPVPPPPAPNTPVPSSSSVVTVFGDYTPCIQQGIHQSNCFQSNGAWDAPNMGSIEMEPQIVVWGNCTADAVQSMQLYVNQPPQQSKCSKTMAGWFPM